VTKVDQVIALAGTEIGKPYVYDTAGPNTFDCSGLITYLFAQVGISLPHNAAEQQQATARVTNPLPGDLVFYGQPAGHVGLYIGGGKMISAPGTGQKVHIVGVGAPTNYGRVSGLGTATAPAIGTVSAVTTGALSAVGDWLGSARYIVLEAVAVGLGVALVGFGLWRAETPLRQSITRTVGDIL
jgi:hypothetical protein